jgi:hypothetical protein
MANDLTSNAAGAAMAWRSATEDAGNFIDSMMQDYGWTMAGPDGTYSTINAGDAFDPNNIMSFGEGGRANVDASKVAALTSGGKYGGQGVFADIMRSGGSEEASAVSQAMSRGLGTGSGLAKQQRALAEDITSKNAGLASADLFKKLFAQYGGVGKSYSNLYQAQIGDAASGAQSGSQYV